MSISLTSSLWSHLTLHLQEPAFPSRQGEIFLLQLPKMGGNLVYRAFVLVAMAVAVLVTPLLFLIDSLSPSEKKSTRNMPSSSEYKSVENVGKERRLMKQPSILEFYRGDRNPQGVSLEDIWSFNNQTLESKHDYIQWLFPLLEKSRFNPNAATTNLRTMSAFQQDPQLQEKFRKSYELMLQFYGLTRMGPAANFEERARVWLNPDNHNFLRITRILTSLRLHGLEKESKEFFSLLQGIYQTYSSQIGAETFSYWQSTQN